ncbi:tyrosine-type recombinase/integrase [Nocardia sp. NPDC052278]|uniref:tyrosine-type recombinase/integrase n=1 Tax=unclassified Nocardia TaxID=2637762 RepID=UPI00369A562B
MKKSKVQPITPHDLRHTCASLTISEGGNVLALAGLLGHKDTKETLNTYTDLFDDDLDKLANAAYAPKDCGQLWARRTITRSAGKKKPPTWRFRWEA